jgi:hypothetical protein
MMKLVAVEMEADIEKHIAALHAIPETRMSSKPAPGKWSKKEIMGHLIDSAQTNIRRFISAQYEDEPYIVYNQDKWVLLNGYQQWDTKNIIELWYQLNKQICRILETMPPGAAERNCRSEAVHTIGWLATDYLKHLRHHLHVVLELEPVAYP